MGKGTEGPTCVHLGAEGISDMEVVEVFKGDKVETEVSSPPDSPLPGPVVENSIDSEKEEEFEASVDNPTYENGETGESNVVEKTKDEEVPEPEKVEDEIDKRRLYFVRMPKPPEQSPAIAAIQQELEHLQTQIKLLDVNMKVQRVCQQEFHTYLLNNHIAYLVVDYLRFLQNFHVFIRLRGYAACTDTYYCL